MNQTNPNKTNDNDQSKQKAAFPVYAKDDGMTLRDYFAAAILPHIYADCDTNIRAARDAYEIADAMLEERAKEK